MYIYIYIYIYVYIYIYNIYIYIYICIIYIIKFLTLKIKKRLMVSSISVETHILTSLGKLKITFQSTKSKIICYCICAKNKEKNLFDKSCWSFEN